MSETTVKKQNRLQAWMSSFKAMSAADKRRTSGGPSIPCW